jgi:DNA repair protein RadA/Sms
MYQCTKCYKKFVKYSGKCFNCDEWNSLKEEVNEKTIVVISNEEQEVLHNSISEFQRVLKLYTKSVVILGGEPGIGKSTLMCQISHTIEGSCLYLCGEEHSQTVKNRMIRVNGDVSNKVNIVDFLFIENLEDLIIKHKPKFLILDSIHTTRSTNNDSSKDIIDAMVLLSRKHNFCAILISHITKEGIISGPKTLEHMVDAVAYIEGDRYGSTRFLRSIKNRFGPTGETGIFQMEENGMIEVKNPSALFISNRRANAYGSAVFPLYAGIRPYLLEIQALVVESQFFNIESIGIDSKRINMIIAILHKWCKVNFFKYNIFINVVGGMKVNDPGADLAIAAALLSSLWQKPIDNNSCFFGELGLTGEIRRVNGEKIRVNEALRMGFTIYANTSIASDKHILHMNDIVEITKILK